MSRACVMAGWDDVPHLSEEDKVKYAANYLPHQKDARTKGIPSLGAGAIFPIAEGDYVVNPIELPPYWPRVAALDTGWKRTAALWGAWDRESDTVYCYSEHYLGEAKAPIHAAAIKARGDWIPIIFDPAARGRSQVDGQRLYSQYVDLELNMKPAQKAVEAGLLAVLTMLSEGRLKVFATLTNFLYEIRMYRRDEKGQVVKANDHLMDCLRYMCMSYRTHATTKPEYTVQQTRYVGIGDRTAGY